MGKYIIALFDNLKNGRSEIVYVTKTQTNENGEIYEFSQGEREHAQAFTDRKAVIAIAKIAFEADGFSGVRVIEL